MVLAGSMASPASNTPGSGRGQSRRRSPSTPGTAATSWRWRPWSGTPGRTWFLVVFMKDDGQKSCLADRPVRRCSDRLSPRRLRLTGHALRHWRAVFRSVPVVPLPGAGRHEQVAGRPCWFRGRGQDRPDRLGKRSGPTAGSGPASAQGVGVDCFGPASRPWPLAKPRALGDRRAQGASSGHPSDWGWPPGGNSLCGFPGSRRPRRPRQDELPGRPESSPRQAVRHFERWVSG